MELAKGKSKCLCDRYSYMNNDCDFIDGKYIASWLFKAVFSLDTILEDFLISAQDELICQGIQAISYAAFNYWAIEIVQLISKAHS